MTAKTSVQLAFFSTVLSFSCFLEAQERSLCADSLKTEKLFFESLRPPPEAVDHFAKGFGFGSSIFHGTDSLTERLDKTFIRHLLTKFGMFYLNRTHAREPEEFPLQVTENLYVLSTKGGILIEDRTNSRPIMNWRFPIQVNPIEVSREDPFEIVPNLGERLVQMTDSTLAIHVVYMFLYETLDLSGQARLTMEIISRDRYLAAAQGYYSRMSRTRH